MKLKWNGMTIKGAKNETFQLAINRCSTVYGDLLDARRFDGDGVVMSFWTIFFAVLFAMWTVEFVRDMIDIWENRDKTD